ncbi:SusC/RagA family TonB-linked outer membrane protein [Pedobacter duraquae]|uniref:TonB-linked SusC/RagA family outer membrane protein n=1 Tax=Pedobacter duraquae TaxID=425511 RepID=A0A4V3C458_9SPHI|nr:SusC/RagA family TonB-linked outer membrane protein [Pedobacter duraquae]TDO24618.1 TonB-linked SusC/RagA family outer membrane protein [Pedobacter duraquae]
MEKNTKGSNTTNPKLRGWRQLLLVLHVLIMGFVLLIDTAYAQQRRIISGTVMDDQQKPISGANITVKGTNIKTQTGSRGEFSMDVPADKQILTVAYVGMKAQEVNISGKTSVRVTMRDNTDELEEVVIVGYGVQKKQSVVGAISQTTSETLERTGGVSSLGAALTGNLPGVITTASTGMPGEEDPQILIRGRSTWNNASPLILVDGVERSMNNIDISSVASVSVLKDASATAVFGVKGANGVILITTKRGREGKAEIRASANSALKSASKLPGKLDSYDMFQVRNRTIEYELGLAPGAWSSYLPEDIMLKYRSPANLEEAERYPNVDWVNTLFRDYAMSYNANLNVSGGTSFVKYFSSVDYLDEADLFRRFENNRGYSGGYSFKRLNVRSNLDFQLTPSTVFRANIAGSRGLSDRPWIDVNPYNTWTAAYSAAPNLYLPKYADGSWGFYKPNEQQSLNSARIVATSGLQQTTTSRITTDFTLDQNLNFLLNGLNFKGTLSVDNTFIEAGRGINDGNNGTLSKYIDPETGIVSYSQTKDAATELEWRESVRWATAAGIVNNGATFRRMFSQFQLNYAKTIADKHNFTGMALWSRDKSATGSIIPSYREDWVFRTTYNYAGKYSLEYNGAYNGSEKFGPEYRFDFFSSGGVGWMISEEKFMKRFKFINSLKLRGSYGEIGDDGGSPRFAFLTNWAFGGTTPLGITGEAAEQSPYNWYREASVGNPNVRWEKVVKKNIAVDFGIFDNMLTGSVDVFQDDRSDILTGSARAVPSYYGAQPPTFNVGRVKSKGYEVDLRFNKRLNKNLTLWTNINFTHAKNKVIDADVAELLPLYSKPIDKQIGQAYSYVSKGYYNTWDELYASTMHNANDNQKLPGNYHIIDYNGDGIIDANDNIPFGYSGAPQNTYNATVGFDWKGFSVFAQFYAVNNVTRQVVLGSFSGKNTVAYDEGTYWSQNNTNPDGPMPRWESTPADYFRADRFMFDGSYIRLKNAEIAYTFRDGWIKKAGAASLRIFINGNNLHVWTKMPDDREANYQGSGGQGWASQGAYPTVKRYNLGANFTF